MSDDPSDERADFIPGNIASASYAPPLTDEQKKERLAAFERSKAAIGAASLANVPQKRQSPEKDPDAAANNLVTRQQKALDKPS